MVAAAAARARCGALPAIQHPRRLDRPPPPVGGRQSHGTQRAAHCLVERRAELLNIHTQDRRRRRPATAAAAPSATAAAAAAAAAGTATSAAVLLRLRALGRGHTL